MYDTIVIGSRCAGAPTAMLLARRGRRVLLVDRATFPSDVLSGHTIKPAGLAHLAKLHHLVELDLYGCHVTDAGLAHLRGLRHLERLNLLGCAGDRPVLARRLPSQDGEQVDARPQRPGRQVQAPAAGRGNIDDRRIRRSASLTRVRDRAELLGERSGSIESTAADRGAQGALFDRCFGRTGGAEALRWRYDACPHGSTIAPITFEDGRLVASYACSPRRVLHRGELLSPAVGQTGDVMTDPELRSRGVFTALHWRAIAAARHVSPSGTSVT